VVAWFNTLANITLFDVGFDIRCQSLPVVLSYDKFDGSSYAVIAASDLVVVVTHENLIA
jgi:hypothetical protein